jgi:hypothetical protein
MCIRTQIRVSFGSTPLVEVQSEEQLPVAIQTASLVSAKLALKFTNANVLLTNWTILLGGCMRIRDGSCAVWPRSASISKLPVLVPSRKARISRSSYDLNVPEVRNGMKAWLWSSAYYFYGWVHPVAHVTLLRTKDCCTHSFSILVWGRRLSESDRELRSGVQRPYVEE